MSFARQLKSVLTRCPLRKVGIFLLFAIILTMFTLSLAVIRFFKTLLNGFRDHEFRAVFFIAVLTLITGTTFYHKIEGWRWLDSLYFSVTTLTTVGFGDFSPQTDEGKIFTIIYVFIGIGTILAFINAVARQTRKGYSVEAQEKIEQTIKKPFKRIIK